MRVNKDPYLINQLSLLCNNIKQTVGRFGDLEAFKKDIDYEMAIAFYLVQIGEMINKISDEKKRKYPYIPWKGMRGFRNRIVHEYATVDKELIFQVVKEAIPILESFCKKELK